MAKIEGDPQAVEALKAVIADNKDYLRFLLGEAESSVDHSATFTGKDGVKYRLQFDPASGRLEVLPAPQ